MAAKLTVIILALIVCYCQCVYVYSSFWAPLYNPKLLNYKVDADFDPNAGKAGKSVYERKFGYRGERLIEDLGNGVYKENNEYKNNNGDVKFYYTLNRIQENRLKPK